MPDYQSPESLAPILEALLFASDTPLSAQELRALVLGEAYEKSEPISVPDHSVPEPTLAMEEPSFNSEIEVAAGPGEEQHPNGQSAAAPEKKRRRKQLLELSVIHTAVEQLNAAYESNGRAFRVIEIAGGYQFSTRGEFGEYVARLYKEKSRRRLSGAALESLAIIAYKQPISKNDVENIRGVNCDEVLKSLLEKNLITITGRAETVGRPLLYGTTEDFLRHFGLPRIHDLPRPREIEELMKEESVRATTLEEAATEFVDPEFADTADDVTVDEAIAVARELENNSEDLEQEEPEPNEEEFAEAQDSNDLSE
ncbi:MAG TPA: SMC-Scp complex subunit ScpB [Candidatus Kapabacteria bacterium]|jgi:segregation and condensation protein B